MALAQKTEIRWLHVENLKLDKDVQMRGAINRTAVCDYGDLLEEWVKAGAKRDDYPFPPLIVYWQ